MANRRDEFDSPWKKVLEDYFSDFMAFFFPNIHQDIDWDSGYEFLDTELQKAIASLRSSRMTIKTGDLKNFRQRSGAARLGFDFQ